MEENNYFVLPFPYKEKEDFYKDDPYADMWDKNWIRK